MNLSLLTWPDVLLPISHYLPTSFQRAFCRRRPKYVKGKFPIELIFALERDFCTIPLTIPESSTNLGVVSGSDFSEIKVMDGYILFNIQDYQCKIEIYL